MSQPNQTKNQSEIVFGESVDIYRLRAGLTLIAAFPQNGYAPDQARFARHLKVGQTYTVDRFEIDSWVTLIWLREISDAVFNSVQFVEAES